MDRLLPGKFNKKKSNVKDILSDSRQIFLVGCWLYNQTKSGETLKDMFRLYRARLLNFVNSYCRQVFFYQTGNNMGDSHFHLGLVEPEAFVHLSGFWNHDWICLRHLSKRSRNKAKPPAPAASDSVQHKKLDWQIFVMIMTLLVWKFEGIWIIRSR